MTTAPKREVGGKGLTASQSTAESNVVTVFGGTGKQGGSVVRVLLDVGTYKVRVPTRNISSDAAQSLRGQGVEVVVGDMNDDGLVRSAVAGARAVYAVTDSWDPATGSGEVDQGVRVAKAAKDAGVSIFIWSGLPNTHKISKGKYEVPVFTRKAVVWEEVKRLGFVTAVSIEAAFYFQNFNAVPGLGFSKGSDGNAVFTVPMLEEGDRLAGFDVGDTGAPIGEILANPQRFNKKRIVFNSVCNQPLSGYLEDFHRATQVKATLKTVPHNEAAAASADLADMFAYYKDHEYYGGETEDIIDIGELSNVASSLTTFDQYIVKADLAATVK